MSVHLQDVSALSPMPPPRDHNSTASIKRRPRPQHRATRNGRKVTGTCKTCTPCRAKKIRCDGERPQCGSCTNSHKHCIYPQDGRRQGRLTAATVQSLETNIASLWKQLQNISSQPSHEWFNDSELGQAHGSQTELWTRCATATYMHDAPELLGQPAYRPFSPRGDFVQASEILSPTTGVVQSAARPVVGGDETLNDSSEETEVSIGEPPGNDQTQGQNTSGPSPSEVRIAGLVDDDGSVIVHGVSSILHQKPTQIAIDQGRIPLARKQANQASSARLISNAILRRQQEGMLYRQMRCQMEFDGLDPETAKHLLDLHWNRQHYAYLLTYRPAVMDSLSNNGPYANKLLLNAIYYSSCLYSDRINLLTDPSDPKSSGIHFYDRFRTLLADEIVRPSLPTAVALLLCGATLLSHGKPSAGWTLCGTAYRMIIDLGCHLMVDRRHPSSSSEPTLFTDIEREMRKRLYWGAFITDATQSLYLGRAPALDLSEARVPLVLLDTYEELDDWAPYIDPTQVYSTPSSPPYSPQPAYAISTFTAMARLFQISSSISRTFYRIGSIKQTTEVLKAEKQRVQAELDNWVSSLPLHLRFRPGEDPTPPPHQITPHTSFFTLNILLQRPFLLDGHLRKHSENDEEEAGNKICVDAALAIRKLVEAYRMTFTLRRAPFLLSYAVYSAVTVILNQSRAERLKLREHVRFFWTTLSELQLGCNFGLYKPLLILKDMMHELGEDMSSFDAMHQNHDRVEEATYAQPNTLGMGAGFLGTPQAESSTLGVWDEESTITDDMLYGLFVPQ